MGRFSCRTMDASATTGPPDTIDAQQTKRQQRLEIPVRPQEGQEVKGDSGGTVYIHGGDYKGKRGWEIRLYEYFDDEVLSCWDFSYSLICDLS